MKNLGTFELQFFYSLWMSFSLAMFFFIFGCKFRITISQILSALSVTQGFSLASLFLMRATAPSVWNCLEPSKTNAWKKERGSVLLQNSKEDNVSNFLFYNLSTLCFQTPLISYKSVTIKNKMAAYGLEK